MGKPVSVAVHIGAHKTATSHFQKSLSAQRELLIDAGIRTYGPDYLRRPGRSIQAMFGLPMRDARPARRSPQDQIAFLAKGGTRIVFTEENLTGSLHDGAGGVVFPLCQRAEDRLTPFAAKIAPSPLDVFLCIRDPAGFLTSAYGQTILGGGLAMTPDVFRVATPLAAVNWADVVTRLRAIAQINKVTVWRYEDYAQVFRLVCRRMLRWRIGGQMNPLPSRVHEGLSAQAVAQYFDWRTKGLVSDDLGLRARAAHPVSQGHAKFRLFDDVEIAASARAYAAQIARIEAIDGVTLLHPPTPKSAKT